MAGKKRLLLVGWDSADWKLIHPLLDQGKLPGVKQLVEGGVSGNLGTLEPQLSPMLWTSIATGRMAYQHGVHGFTEVDPVNGGIVPVSAATRKCATVWEMLAERGLRSHVVGWFATQGERDLNGKMVSNMFAHLKGVNPELSPADWPPPMPGTYWPENLGDELNPLRVSPLEITGDIIRAFVPDAPGVDQERDRRLQELAARLAEAYSVQSAATYLMETDPDWDFMAVYFRAIDEISHVFMPYHPPQMEGVPERDFEMYRHVVSGAYQAHDMMLQRLIHLAGPDTAVVLVSDHGFHSDHLRPKFTPQVPAGITVWHRAQGVIMANGPGFRQDELIHGARLLDITPTILHYFGLPVGEDMEGRVLGEAFGECPPVATIPTWENPDRRKQGRSSLSADESKALLDQFVALGYIDEIPSDPTAAAAETNRENRWNLARACLYGGKYEMALPLLEECHAACPGRADFSELLARTQLQLGLLEEAEETLKSCLDSLGQSHSAQLLMGGIETARGNHAKALEHLAVVREHSPENIQVLHSLSDTYLALRRWREAEETAGEMLLLDPGNAQACLILARCFLHQGKNAEAVQAALDAVGLQYGNPRGHFLLGISLARQQDWPAAERALRNTLQLNPDNGLAARFLSHVYRAMDRPDDALKADLRSRELQARNHARRETRVRNLRLESNLRREERRHGSGNDSPSIRTGDDSDIFPAEFTIVSGLPRSGTSLMMQILRAGGMELMHDEKRPADDDNLEGYWEWEEIKSLRKNPRVIEQAKGKVIKIVSALLPALPPGHRYKIIFMRRPVSEVVESQWKMLANRGALPKSEKSHLIASQETHVGQILATLRASERVELLEIDYPDLIADPESAISRILAFLGNSISANPETLGAVVRPELYRNRISADCVARCPESPSAPRDPRR
jgi:predicted AlkP superfamily phosphohydrolase/phosphomutase/tetratricopeptide (TPR) repeat protein